MKPWFLTGSAINSLTFSQALLLGFSWLWLVAAGTGEGVIQGRIYISPTGEAEGDLVMRAADVEVILLRGEGDFEAELAALRQSRSPTIAKQLQAVTRAQEEFLRSAAGAREEREKKSARLIQERARLAELREAYTKGVSELMAKHTFAKVKTDSEGKFNFEKIPRGHYFIHAHFEIVGMDIHYYWLLPLELEREREKKKELSLNKLNATPVF